MKRRCVGQCLKSFHFYTHVSRMYACMYVHVRGMYVCMTYKYIDSNVCCYIQYGLFYCLLSIYNIERRNLCSVQKSDSMFPTEIDIFMLKSVDYFPFQYFSLSQHFSKTVQTIFFMTAVFMMFFNMHSSLLPQNCCKTVLYRFTANSVYIAINSL